MCLLTLLAFPSCLRLCLHTLHVLLFLLAWSPSCLFSFLSFCVCLFACLCMSMWSSSVSRSCWKKSKHKQTYFVFNRFSGSSIAAVCGRLPSPISQWLSTLSGVSVKVYSLLLLLLVFFLQFHFELRWLEFFLSEVVLSPLSCPWTQQHQQQRERRGKERDTREKRKRKETKK